MFSSLILCNLLYSNFLLKFFKIRENNEVFVPSASELSLLIGKNYKNIPVYISEKSLYQNILITGGIGTGKTASAMYPFTKQLINYMNNDFKKQVGLLILDVIGNL